MNPTEIAVLSHASLILQRKAVRITSEKKRRTLDKMARLLNRICRLKDTSPKESFFAESVMSITTRIQEEALSVKPSVPRLGRLLLAAWRELPNQPKPPAQEEDLDPLSNADAVAEWGRRLRARREDTCLTRAQLAAKAGVADSSIRNAETGRHRPTRSTMLKLEAVLGRLGPEIYPAQGAAGCRESTPDGRSRRDGDVVMVSLMDEADMVVATNPAEWAAALTTMRKNRRLSIQQVAQLAKLDHHLVAAAEEAGLPSPHVAQLLEDCFEGMPALYRKPRKKLVRMVEPPPEERTKPPAVQIAAHPQASRPAAGLALVPQEAAR